MSVFKPNDSPFYYIAVTNEHGIRERFSSKKETKREAMAIEAEYRNRVERIRLGLEVRDKNPEHMTVAQAVEWWLTTIAHRQAQGAKVRPVVEKHLSNGVLGKRQLEHVTPAMATSWLHTLSEKSPATANKCRAYLMGIYSRLIEHGAYLGENPMKLTKRITQTPSSSRKLPPAYVQVLMSNPPTLGWLVAFTTAAYAGMRRGEIERAFGAGWPGVDLDARIIELRKTKTGRPRRVAIHPVLLDVLEDAKRRNVAMPTRGAYEGSNDRVRDALKRAGIVDKRATFHGLRATWATQMIVCGASSDLVRFMGWGPRKDSVMDLHYVAYPDDVLRGEIDKLHYPIRGEDE